MVGKRTGLWLAMVALLLGACAPAATPTSAPRATAEPMGAATATPTAPGPGVSPPQATPTPKPTAVVTRPSAAKPKYGGTLRFAEQLSPGGWDPFKFVTLDVSDFMGLLHARLGIYNQKGPGCSFLPVEPSLAVSWAWVNDVTLEAKLRQGVKYPNLPPMNGREMVAADVVFSAQNGWPVAGRLESALGVTKNIEAVDKYTVRFHLTMPYADYPDQVMPSFVAIVLGPELYQGRKVLARFQDNVGLGPYIPGEYVTGVKLTVKKNPNYWQQGLPYMDEVEFRIIPDLSTQVAAMTAGKVDVMRPEAAPVIAQMDRSMPKIGKAICLQPPPPTVAMRTDMEPHFADVRVRRALSMALDRQAILRTVQAGYGAVAHTGVTPLFGDFFLKEKDIPPELRRYVEYRPDEARKLLAEAGYPNGFTTPLIISARYGHQPLAEAIADFWSKIGVTVKLEVREHGQFLDTVTRDPTKYRGAAIMFPSRGLTLEEVVWDPYYSGAGNRNRSFVKDPKIDSMLQAQRGATNEAARRKLVHDLQLYLIEQQYYITTPMQPLALFWQPWVKDIDFRSVQAVWGDWVIAAWLDL